MTSSDFDSLPLIPAPASGRLLSGTFLLSGNTSVAAPSALAGARETLLDLIADLPPRSNVLGAITLDLDSSLVGDETHRLHITPTGIALHGCDPGRHPSWSANPAPTHRCSLGHNRAIRPACLALRRD